MFVLSVKEFLSSVLKLDYITLLQNLVESASVILQPAYSPHWQRINGVRGFGADSLLTKMDEYVATLAASQGDTYTTPFEVPTKHISKDTGNASKLSG